MDPRIVIALGGNALGDTPTEQKARIREVSSSLVGLIRQGYEIIVSHGNGPQVGMISSAFSHASRIDSAIPRMPLAECTAMSQGYIGFHLQNGILRELRREGMPWHVASMVTQVIVSGNDPAFSHPTKPIGPFLSPMQAEEAKKTDPTLVFREEPGKGLRRCVASPYPIGIVERDSILNLLDNEFIVIACGGGGIPVIRSGEGEYTSVDAVIDKDAASAILADACSAEIFFILTAVDRVCLDYGKPGQKEIVSMTADEAEKYCDEGQFAPGSMLPKVRAGISFVRGGKGRRCVITSLRDAPKALSGQSGTEIVS